MAISELEPTHSDKKNRAAETAPVAPPQTGPLTIGEEVTLFLYEERHSIAPAPEPKSTRNRKREVMHLKEGIDYALDPANGRIIHDPRYHTID